MFLFQQKICRDDLVDDDLADYSNFVCYPCLGYHFGNSGYPSGYCSDLLFDFDWVHRHVVGWDHLLFDGCVHDPDRVHVLDRVHHPSCSRLDPGLDGNYHRGPRVDPHYDYSESLQKKVGDPEVVVLVVVRDTHFDEVEAHQRAGVLQMGVHPEGVVVPLGTLVEVLQLQEEVR